MTTLPKDTVLENELQELYIIARHWQGDVEFIAEELNFFKNIQKEYATNNAIIANLINDLEKYLANLKTFIPYFLNLVSPYLDNPDRSMDLDFLEKYNGLRDGIKTAFEEIRSIKRLLFKQITQQNINA